ERTFTNNIDTMVICSTFDGSLVGNKYVQFWSAEAQKHWYETGMIFMGGGSAPIEFLSDTLVSRQYDDVGDVLKYEIVGNQVIIKGRFGDEIYNFDPSCQEKFYSLGGTGYYKSNN